MAGRKEHEPEQRPEIQWNSDRPNSMLQLNKAYISIRIKRFLGECYWVWVSLTGVYK